MNNLESHETKASRKKIFQTGRSKRIYEGTLNTKIYFELRYESRFKEADSSFL